MNKSEAESVSLARPTAEDSAELSERKTPEHGTPDSPSVDTDITQGDTASQSVDTDITQGDTASQSVSLTRPTAEDTGAMYAGTAERELGEHGVYMTNTIGHSMEPFLSHHRDAVVIAKREREPRKYDVVLYPGRGGSYILHRIIAVRPDHFIIRGDNNYFREYVPKDRVIGVLVSFTRKGKRGEVTDLGYRLYSRMRVAGYPLRVLARRARALLAKLYRAVFRRKKR